MTTESLPWHALPPDEALAKLAADGDAGLGRDEARERLATHGPNALPAPGRRSLAAVFAGQFRSPLIYLLLGASAVALAFGHTSDAVVIFVVVLLNAAIGAFQEGRAERSLASLRKLEVKTTRVVRDGDEHQVRVRELVPGDVVVLEAGDEVPADARLLEASALQVAEAALTGESVPVTKAEAKLPEDTALADRTTMVHAGTHVTAGRARGLVVATGTSTEIGHIATLASSATESRTPLERRVARFGRYVIYAAGAVFALVVALGLARGLEAGEIVMVGISQVVGMIPEGLPVAMTIALAVGVQRMARRRAVVRRLAAVETLGSTTVICTDKTGTLTRNEMTVTAIALPGGEELEVTGVGYAAEGSIEGGDTPRELVEAAVLCSDAKLDGATPIGDPTEVALVVLAKKAGLDPAEVRRASPRTAEIPFDPAAKLMATQHGSRVIVKGAPEEVLALCDVDDGERRRLLASVDGMANRALRVLAVATADGAALDSFEALRGRMRLLGFLGQIDPPRREVGDAVAACRDAGIRAVMVTGDHKATGHAIARDLGIAKDDEVAVDGRELERMSDAELARRIDDIAVFARVHPAQKLRIVRAYQQRGEVVAMTGDGVNDAPALVQADVGVAMGVTGTEVAKEAAKIVVTDDNFSTIVSAVEEGRVVYRNIKKAVLLLFSTSAAEVVVLLLAMLLGYPLPFLAVQILWNNLVTEGLITVNLIMEPPEGDEMRRPPIPPDEPLLTRILLARMAIVVPTMVIATLGWFIIRLSTGVPEAQARTETFVLLAICEWFNVLNCRSETKSALSLSLFRNPWLVGGLVLGNLLQIAVVFWEPLNSVFHTVPFGLDVVLELALVGSLVLWVEELRKLVVRRRLASAQAVRPEAVTR